MCSTTTAWPAAQSASVAPALRTSAEREIVRTFLPTSALKKVTLVWVSMTMSLGGIGKVVFSRPWKADTKLVSHMPPRLSGPTLLNFRRHYATDFPANGAETQGQAITTARWSQPISNYHYKSNPRSQTKPDTTQRIQCRMRRPG